MIFKSIFSWPLPIGLLRLSFDCDCACAAAPNYQPVADASKEAAEVMAQLGREQIAESKRQYDLNKEVIDPIIIAQKGILDETARQGKDYYDYMVSQQRPVEQALNAEAMAAGSQEKQDEAAARAIADSQGGYTRALNQAFRQSRRYGLQPQNMAGSQMLQQAQNTAAAAGIARDRERDIGYAKKLDIAGLYRGLPGASVAAYGAATNAGNSAAGNQMLPGQALTNGMVAGAGTIGQGQQLNLQGNLGILNAQTSYANSMNQAMMSGDSGLGGLGSLLGGAASMYTAFKSDRRLKENIVAVGADEKTGLTLYEFAYKGDPSGTRFRGVMADEVESVMPDAVVHDDLGFASVNYAMLGIEMVEV